MFLVALHAGEKKEMHISRHGVRHEYVALCSSEMLLITLSAEASSVLDSLTDSRTGSCQT